MSVMSEPSGSGDCDSQLSAQLRSLPQLAPKRSAWPDLAQRLPGIAPAPVRSPRRWRSGWQCAAAIATVAIGLLLWRQPPPIRLGQTIPVASKLTALVKESQHWEQTLRQLDPYSGAVDARTALVSAEVEDLIGMTDLQLGAAPDLAEAEALWQRRIGLMRRLAEIRTDAAWQQARPDQQLSQLSFNQTVL